MRALSMSCLLIALVSLPAVAFDEGWPREISFGEGTVVIYQPQIESFAEINLEARVAVSVTANEMAAPVFGAVWIAAVVETDRVARTVTILDVDVKRVRFPESSADQETRLTNLFEQEIPTWRLELSLDRLIADLEAAGLGENPSAGLNNAPPKIIMSYEPALLVLIDGEPILADIAGSALRRVVNTPYFLVKRNESYFLAAKGGWFVATNLDGPWQLESRPPRDVAALTETSADSTTETSAIPVDDRVPRIVVSSEPAELIFIDGPPKLTPVADTDLLFVSNTDSDILLDIQAQAYFLLLSGRWFTSPTLTGTWTFVAADELPGYFAEIPVDSENGHLLASVAGTDQARDAILDASIPQTAAVKRDATITVEYDDEPSFLTIDGTHIAYALNSASAVLLIAGAYYCCDEAVWYESVSPHGPWKVSVLVPVEVATIPPSSPVYNVTYVKVYHSTPEVVYVGYTPGYMGSYVYHGSVVYGTGWYYRPWYGHYYYPRPCTWGFHARYNPWYGWSYGWSYSNSPFYPIVGWGGYDGWWGPAYYYRYPSYAYRYGYRHDYDQGHWHGYRTGYQRPDVNSTRPPRTGGTTTVTTGNRNIYARPVNAPHVAQTRDPGQQRRPAASQTRPNNVFTDADGNLHRRNSDGSWDRRQSGSWQRSEGASGTTRPAPPAASARPTPETGARTGSAPIVRPTREAAPAPNSRPASGANSRPGATRSTTTSPRSSQSQSLEKEASAREKGQQRATSYQHGATSGVSRSSSPSGATTKPKAKTGDEKPAAKKK